VSEGAAAMIERIRRIAEEGRRAAQGEEAPPTLARHWSELAERESEAEEATAAAREPARSVGSGRSRLSLEMGEVSARETACARLRKLLADGAWHSALELQEVAGFRYGGRLFELRRGDDGGPALDVEAEARAGGARQLWWYRVAPSRADSPRKFDFFSENR
jgi:hypothetical protein